MSRCDTYEPLPRPDSLGCGGCGRPRDEHPFIAGQPERPFDPIPKIPNAGYDRGGDDG